ncbi:MAG: polysaccharide deacetylase [Chloroflexi bacterium]|nr:polysaccharide deacetylase [Chloroflexota bacterium]
MRYRWPNGAQCAVVLSFDVDAESGFIYRFPNEAATQLDEMEERRFGVRTGVYRILRLLEKYGLPATFFVPGFTIEHHTKAVEAIHAAGHELACHGNVHETLSTLDEAAERRAMQEQLDIYRRYLGIKPVGYRSPSWSLNLRTPGILKEHGFVYDSSLMGDDIPYFVGTPHGELAEVPVQWLLDDAPFYRHVYGSTNGIAEPDRVIRLWEQEFRGMYQENGAFVLTMHPWISGRAGRMAGLEQLIRAIKAEPNVWWATCQQVAAWQIETRQNLDVTVPLPPTA